MQRSPFENGQLDTPQHVGREVIKLPAQRQTVETVVIAHSDLQQMQHSKASASIDRTLDRFAIQSSRTQSHARDEGCTKRK